ncbi:MAG: hypothetical protein WC670_18280 [Pseudolabrys sp.]
MIDLRTRQGFEDIKRILDDRPDDVLALCGIALPEKRGGTIVIDDPRGSGRGNFALWLKADGLSWKNYTTDEKGRLLELIAYCNGWYHLDKRGGPEAARFAVERLGLGSVDKAQLERDRVSARAKADQAQKDADASLKRQRAAAFKLFTDTAVPILGTPGEFYLRHARGIDLRAAPFIGLRGGSRAPGCLRFVPRHKYVHRDKGGNKIGESFHPAIIACCVDADMRIVAVHQTWLQDDGSDKVTLAPAPDGTEQKARKVFPSCAGAVIPLWRGQDYLSVPDALENFRTNGVMETLQETEGVEDGLTAVLASPRHRTWAMISLSNMVHVAGRVPDFIDAVIVHRQNDWDKPAAVAQFERGLKAHRDAGLLVAEVAAFGGKDLNDTLRGVT